VASVRPRPDRSLRVVVGRPRAGWMASIIKCRAARPDHNRACSAHYRIPPNPRCANRHCIRLRTSEPSPTFRGPDLPPSDRLCQSGDRRYSGSPCSHLRYSSEMAAWVDIGSVLGRRRSRSGAARRPSPTPSRPK
jgi:hypothetical protein